MYIIKKTFGRIGKSYDCYFESLESTPVGITPFMSSNIEDAKKFRLKNEAKKIANIIGKTSEIVKVN